MVDDRRQIELDRKPQVVDQWSCFHPLSFYEGQDCPECGRVSPYASK